MLNFFLVNFFAGALCDHFIHAKDNANPLRMFCISEEQQKWMDYQKMILKVDGEHFENLAVIKNRFRLLCFKIIKSEYFEIFKTISIFANIIIISLPYEGSSKEYYHLLIQLDFLLIAMFLIEFIITVIGSGLKGYLNSFLNRLDVILICFAFVEIFLTQDDQSIKYNQNLLKLLRSIRILRLLKLVRNYPDIKRLLDSLLFSLPSLLNVGALYLTIFYIYATIGVFLFHSVVSGNIIDDYNNFHNIGFAFVTCFRMVTGENWWVIMFDCYPVSTDGNASNYVTSKFIKKIYKITIN